MPSMDPTPSDFGPFTALFTRAPHYYLTFLNMNSDAVQSGLMLLSDALNSSDDVRRYVELMLQGRNWRPHVVGAVAALLSPNRPEYVSLLWQTFDYGSWVAPQLAVTLYLSDPDFRVQARQRIASRCQAAPAPEHPSLSSQIGSKNI